MVNGEVGLFEDRSEFKLVGGYLVVAGLTGDAQFEGLDLEVAHEGCHTLRDGAKVVVIHLLVFGRVVAHEGTACEQQVGAGCIEALIYEEVLLLPAEVALNLLHCGIEIVAYLCGSYVDGMQGALQRSLVVESFTTIGDEDGGDTQRIVDDKDGRCGIPGRVAAGLEGGADTARGEGRGIGLLLDEQLTSELLDHAALAIVLDERVVLLGRSFRQRLEPVGVVGNAVLYGPLLHA